MKSVSAMMSFGDPERPTRGEVTAWEDGSVMVTVGEVPVAVEDLPSVVAALRWSALDDVSPRLVSEIPAQEVAARAEAARIEAERAAQEAAAPAPIVATPAEPACVKCGATGVQLLDLPTGAACISCVVAGLAKP